MWILATNLKLDIDNFVSPGLLKGEWYYIELFSYDYIHRSLKMVKIQQTFSDACIAAKSIIGNSMRFSLTHTVLVPLCEVSKDLPLGPYYSKKRFYNKKQS